MAKRCMEIEQEIRECEEQQRKNEQDCGGYYSRDEMESNNKHIQEKIDSLEKEKKNHC